MFFKDANDSEIAIFEGKKPLTSSKGDSTRPKLSLSRLKDADLQSGSDSVEIVQNSQASLRESASHHSISDSGKPSLHYRPKTSN